MNFRRTRGVLFAYFLGAVFLIILWQAIALIMHKPIIPVPEKVFLLNAPWNCTARIPEPFSRKKALN